LVYRNRFYVLLTKRDLGPAVRDGIQYDATPGCNDGDGLLLLVLLTFEDGCTAPSVLSGRANLFCRTKTRVTNMTASITCEAQGSALILSDDIQISQ
jgi:hypothetical protein